jgi:hypothetical protein
MSYLTETTAEAMLTADLSSGRATFNPAKTAEATDPSAHWSDAAIVEAWHEDGSSDLAPVAMIRRDYRSALEAYLATID